MGAGRASNVLYYLLLAAMVVGSFFLYSSRFYPMLNSDDALNVLMAHRYRLPDNLYCMGQNRGGTLIPLLSQLFISLFGASAVVAVSLSNYLVLVLGYVGFASLIRQRCWKVVFALLWFFPFVCFIDLVRFPIGVQYSLMGLALMLIHRMRKPLKPIAKHALLSAVVLILTVAVWVSDLAIVSIAILLVMLLVFHCREHKRLSVDRTVLLYVVVGIVACWTCISIAKSMSPESPDKYLRINGIHEIKEAVGLLAASLWRAFTFRLGQGETVISVFAWLFIVWVVLLVACLIRGGRQRLRALLANRWVVFFMLDFAAIFVGYLFSSWVLANGMERWYYVASYISLSMAIVLILDGLQPHCRLLRYSVWTWVIVGAVSPVCGMIVERQKSWTPMVEQVRDYATLGKVGIIAEYWNAYIVSVPHPDSVFATPHDGCEVKSMALVDSVFAQPKLYVLRDCWMDAFPDTLRQFGRTLSIVGEPFELCDAQLCEYQLCGGIEEMP